MALQVSDSSPFAILSFFTPPSMVFGSYLASSRRLKFDGDSGIYFAFSFLCIFLSLGDLVGFNFGLETIPYSRMGLTSLVAQYVR